jgi:drug/metabolite transporter (DMT)-like permease
MPGARAARADAVSAPATPPRGLVYAVLAAAVVVVSTASILIRYAQAQGVPSLAIAALRLAIAVALLTPLALPGLRRELPGLSRRDLALAAASGAVLALHFAAWITSLEHTSVASSAALVTTNPVWVGIASWLVLRERIRPVVAAGIVLGLAGSGLILASAPAEGAAAPRPLLGNALALCGALAASAYLLIGRGLRARLSLLSYVWIAYGMAALLLLCTAAVSGAFTAPLSPIALALLVALAAGPQLLGHTGVNWAVRHVPATVVALAILGEPLGAAALAWLLFGEGFGALQLAGFGVLLCGIFLAARATD